MKMWLIGEIMMIVFLYILFRNLFRKNNAFMCSIVDGLKRRHKNITDNAAIVMFTVVCWIFLTVILFLASFWFALISKLFQMIISG